MEMINNLLFHVKTCNGGATTFEQVQMEFQIELCIYINYLGYVSTWHMYYCSVTNKCVFDLSEGTQLHNQTEEFIEISFFSDDLKYTMSPMDIKTDV